MTYVSRRFCEGGSLSDRQQGSVLLFALVALVALTLAVLALVRSVDSTTLISGNLAFRQAATTSADAGVEAAIVALTAIQTANSSKNVYMDATHAFNLTNATIGYYSNLDLALDVTAAGTWTDANSSDAVSDGNGNTYRYIVQRMCRTANQVLTKTNCLFSGEAKDNNGKTVPLPSEICEGSGCPAAGQAPQYRVTVRVTGPKNTISYVQALVY
uniref:Type 4 fimbrial biogenesis protein PilX N-terminal domain-containing protein n=1 Tax=Dechloromonas aromatica (strain RCB) TaxID=159087 RepID=Q47BL4_DECAR